MNFKAKPMIGLAGNGEHTHVGMAAVSKSGKTVNVLSPTVMYRRFLKRYWLRRYNGNLVQLRKL